jgi:predicted transcriptional regulator
VELTEIEILMLRGLVAKPLDIPGGIVDDNMGELIDIGYISVRTVGNLFSYEITDDGRAALKRSDGG